jgi:hypothetical protein
MATKKPLPKRGQRAATNYASQPVLSGPSKAQEAKWRAQDDLRTLKSAAEIQSDPSRVKAAQAEAKSQLAALQRVVKK